MELEKKLLDLYLTACIGVRPDIAKECYGFSSIAYARLCDLSRRGYFELIESAARYVEINSTEHKASAEIDLDRIGESLLFHWSRDKDRDDLTLLLLFDAPRTIITQITGEHNTAIALRRKVLGLKHNASPGRVRALESEEILRILKTWRELKCYGAARRLVSTHLMTGFTIGEIWQCLQHMSEPIDFPEPKQAEQAA